MYEEVSTDFYRSNVFPCTQHFFFRFQATIFTYFATSQLKAGKAVLSVLIKPKTIHVPTYYTQLLAVCVEQTSSIFIVVTFVADNSHFLKAALAQNTSPKPH